MALSPTQLFAQATHATPPDAEPNPSLPCATKVRMVTIYRQAHKLVIRPQLGAAMDVAPGHARED
ncbi:hypothetical protein HYPDE_27763 [Hyphomicrobium denitrificans 1NES1]|uniref:Uncharacterized protein n=1 Tax=Hyphomicrobium denitrificans 1NES1 TaxID=670307 RepID=N0B4S6_9HYPH|nr:hypothetical protein HYPDE_27763 [Hyphomicrobium denitrificans 1NES1]